MKFKFNQFDEERNALKDLEIKNVKMIKKKYNFQINWIFIFIKNILEYVILSIPFILMDYFIRKEAKKVILKTGQLYSYTLSYIYISFFVFSSKCFKDKIGKIYYSIIFILHFLIFLTNLIFFSFTKNFFQFKILTYANEGSPYMLNVILNVESYIWKDTILTIVSFIFAFFLFRKSNKNDFMVFLCFVVIFIFTQNYAILLFGPEKKKKWNDFNNPKQIYLEFNNPNKCMKTLGFYKYIQLDFFKTYLNFRLFLTKKEKEELKYLKTFYKNTTFHKENEYTGIFKNKNLIFVQLEGMDDWILNEKNTPTLYSLQQNSFIFSQHYSYLIKGGSTFNSEFCVNTGFHSPVSIFQHSYDYFKNKFNSIPRLFKKRNYTLKSFHYNNPEFYNRDINYKGWGYDKHLSLIKTKLYKENALAGLDTELIKNKIFYNEIFNTTGKFVYYFITYSIHFPYKNNYHTHYILQKKFGDKIPILNEDEIAKIQSGETDEFVKLLIEGLKKKNFYNNTVIVFYADHSVMFSNKSSLSKHKIISDKRINHTPFFIWSANLNKTIIDKVNGQLDILPTMLNLFGIPFEENSMIGRDIFDKNNKGIAFFEDYSWIDSQIIVDNGEAKKINNSNDSVLNETYLFYWNQFVRDKFKQNDLTLKHDYLKYILS